MPVRGSADDLRKVIPAHLLPGLEYRGKDGLQGDHDGFKAHGEIILFLIVGNSQYHRQMEQSGAHRVGTADSGESALLHHAFNPYLYSCNQAASPA